MATLQSETPRTKKPRKESATAAIILQDMRKAYERKRAYLPKLQGVYSSEAKRRKDGQKMTTEELKQEIAQRTGVPVVLLTGETAEENIAQAKAFLAYKREHEAQRPKSHAEQFKAWFNEQYGIEEQDEAGAALAQIEEQARLDAGGYPMTKDSGEVTNMPDPRPAREQFAEWFGQKTAFDPFKDADGWKNLF